MRHEDVRCGKGKAFGVARQEMRSTGRVVSPRTLTIQSATELKDDPIAATEAHLDPNLGVRRTIPLRARAEDAPTWPKLWFSSFRNGFRDRDSGQVRDFLPYSLTRLLRYDEGMISKCPLGAGFQSLEAEPGKDRR
jgi:hypothetical protein